MESSAFSQPASVEQDPELLVHGWSPEDFETPAPAETAPRHIALPVALAVGVLGLALLGVSQLIKRRQGQGKSSFVADALRSVSLSVLGVIASRVAERVTTPPLLTRGDS